MRGGEVLTTLSLSPPPIDRESEFAKLFIPSTARQESKGRQACFHSRSLFPPNIIILVANCWKILTDEKEEMGCWLENLKGKNAVNVFLCVFFLCKTVQIVPKL